MTSIGLISSSFQRSSSDRDLMSLERRLTRTRLVSSSSSSNLTNFSKTSSFLPGDRLQKWFYGIAVVTFDLELGHSIEYLLPNHCKLTEREKMNLSYLAFPDTNSKCFGDVQYHFRIQHEYNLSSFDQFYNSIVPGTLQIDRNGLFGFVNFRQTRDKTLKRGYYQKSFVLLTKFPFFALFTTLVQHLAANFFQFGLESLESCLYTIDQQWPEPEPGKTLRLPLFNQLIQVRIPTQGDKPFSPEDLVQYRSVVQETMQTNPSQQTFRFPIDDNLDLPSDSNEEIKTVETSPTVEQRIPQLIPFVHDVNTYHSLGNVLTHIQLLWELILLNEPIAILGNYPNTCSQTVQALVHIIWPLRYAADYRPFFTIQSSEFSDLKTKNSLPVTIIGVTNPLFSKFVHRWAHLLRVNDYSQRDFSTRKPENFLLVEHDDDDDLATKELEESLELSISPPKLLVNPKKISTHSKPFKRLELDQNPSLTFDIKPGLYTKYEPYLHRDKNIFKQLQSRNSRQRPSAVQNLIIRRFFLELTQSFLHPLERYFSSLLPLKKSFSPNRDPPPLKNFDQDEFLKTIDQFGPQLTSGLKGNWKDLYKHFFSTANFRLWLNNRQQEANAKIYWIYAETMANGRLEEDFSLSKLTEIKSIDLVIKFQKILERLQSTDEPLLRNIEPSTRPAVIDKLRIKMQFVIDERLSSDTKTLFQQSFH